MQLLVPAVVAALAVTAFSATTAVTATSAVSATSTVPAITAVKATTTILATSLTPANTAILPASVLPATQSPAGTLAKGEPTAAVSGNPARSSPRGARGFTWPLSPRPVIQRGFEQPKDQWAAGHRGVDLLASVGQPVLSAGEGVVAFSGVIARRGVITIRHSGGLRTTYEPVDARLKSATLVHRGSRIGVIGTVAGHCVPLTCLHWGSITGTAYLDPLSLLGFGRPILLPLG